MNKYIPNEVKDVTESKRRIMQNVMNHIENASGAPKRKWQYGVITAILTMSVIFFLVYEVMWDDDQLSATVSSVDFTKPAFFAEEGLFYLQGVTLGDSQAKVIESLGEKYTLDNHEDGSVADVILTYDRIASFYFYQDKLDSIIFMKVDHVYFDTLFNEYDGFKFLTPTIDDDRYLYSKETGQLLKATFVPDGSLYLYVMHGGKELLENPDFPKIEPIR